MDKTSRRRSTPDEAVKIVARIHGVNERYVRMIRDGKRKNEDILASLVDYEVGKNNLVRHLESLVPLKPKQHAGKAK